MRLSLEPHWVQNFCNTGLGKKKDASCSCFFIIKPIFKEFIANYLLIIRFTMPKFSLKGGQVHGSRSSNCCRLSRGAFNVIWIYPD